MIKREIWVATLVAVATVCSSGGPAHAQCEIAELTASDASLGDSFGWRVRSDGDVIVVGAPNDDVDGSRVGSAYVFRFNGTDWIEEAKLLAFDGAADDNFGSGVSVDGDVIVIGASGDQDNGVNSGSAYVFRYDGTQWIPETKLLPYDGASGDRFGVVVSLCGEVILIGAPWDNDNGPDSGSAYVFRYDGTNWIREAKLLASDGGDFHNFGGSLSLDANTIVIGANQDDDNGFSTGSAYVFGFDGTNWIQEAKLLASDGAAEDRFGRSVSIDGDVIAVGAFLDDDNATNAGSAYVFRFDGTNWVEEAKLLASDGTSADFFGQRVSIGGDVIVVGAPLAPHDNGVMSGAAYVFRFDGKGWFEEAKLFDSDGVLLDEFGKSVAVNGDVVVVGAHRHGTTGAAYVYDLAPNCDCPADLDSSGVVGVLDLLALLTAWGPCPPPPTPGGCDADLNGDWSVDVIDLLALLGAWGSCPGPPD